MDVFEQDNDEIVYRELDSVPQEIRSRWIQEVSVSLKKRNIKNHYVNARKLEQACHANRQKKVLIGEGIYSYQYGSENLLPFDNPQNHVAASVFAYCDSIQRAFWICENSSIKTLQLGLAQNISDFLSEKDEDLCEDTKHAEWEQEFFKRQNEARAFLNVGKDEVKTSGLFSCLSCKSFDVDIEQKQCRSADEGMDIFISCNLCGKRSRIRG